jgi:hypothetical protein
MRFGNANLRAITVLGFVLAAAAQKNAFADVMYVDSYVQGTIDEVEPNGTVTPFVSGLETPEGLAFDSQGNLYVGLQGFGTDGGIDKITPQGVVSTFVTHIVGGVAGLAFDSQGNLYAAIQSGGVDKISPSGKISGFAGGFAVSATGTGGPEGLAFDSQGNLYVVDGAGVDLYKVTPSGATSVYASNVSCFGVALDAAGNAYVGDGFSVNEISANGTVTTIASDVFPVSNGTDEVGGLAFDSSGNLFIPGSTGNVINEISPTGVVSQVTSSITDPLYMADPSVTLPVSLPEPSAIAVVALSSMAMLKRRSRSRQ